MPERKKGSKSHKPGGIMSRRNFLKAGAAGTCALCLAATWSCSPPREEQVQEHPAHLEHPGTAQKGFVQPVRSPWFSRLEDTVLRCELCPRQCTLPEGARGDCLVRENREGEGYTLAYGNPALMQEDPVERKPYFHVLPGQRALSISTAGCNLSCKFCQVWDMALAAPEEVYAYAVPPEKVVAHARDSGVQAVSYAFGEPVIFYEYMSDVAVRAREAGLLNLVHTAGYIRKEPLQALSGLLDAANVDLKSFNPDFYRNVVGGELQAVLETLQLLRKAGLHLEITNIVIPTLNDGMEEIGRMCRWIVQELGADIPLHLARFYPLYKLSALPRTPVSTLEEARYTAREAGLKFVYIANVTGHEGENTFCPVCAEIVIKRVGFVIEKINLENGSCRACGTAIPGRWA